MQSFPFYTGSQRGAGYAMVAIVQPRPAADQAKPGTPVLQDRLSHDRIPFLSLSYVLHVSQEAMTLASGGASQSRTVWGLKGSGSQGRCSISAAAPLPVCHTQLSPWLSVWVLT